MATTHLFLKSPHNQSEVQAQGNHKPQDGGECPRYEGHGEEEGHCHPPTDDEEQQEGSDAHEEGGHEAHPLLSCQQIHRNNNNFYEELIVRFHILEENYLSTDRIFLIGRLVSKLVGQLKISCQ